MTGCQVLECPLCDLCVLLFPKLEQCPLATDRWLLSVHLVKSCYQLVLFSILAPSMKYHQSQHVLHQSHFKNSKTGLVRRDDILFLESNPMWTLAYWVFNECTTMNCLVLYMADPQIHLATRCCSDLTKCQKSPKQSNISVLW